MKRRRFLACLGAATASAAIRPPPLRAQPRMPRVGLMGSAPLRPIEALRQKLRELGYVEGQTFVLEARFAHGRDDRFPGFGAELAGLPVDVIVAWGTPAALAAKHATATIPILFVAGDAVNTGIVSSLSRPEANITGFVAVNAEIEAKRVELLKEIVPRAARIAVLTNALNPLNQVNLETARRAGRALSVAIDEFPVRSSGDIPATLLRLVDSRPDAAILGSDIMLLSGRQQIVDTLNAHRIPAVYPFREYADAGAFIIYGANISHLFQQAAVYVDRLLKGETPDRLPIQQATSFEMIVNLKTAETLGVTLSPFVLARADEVVE
jgi:putative tryptophan/tyrosine transport system substrate-binding protein